MRRCLLEKSIFRDMIGVKMGWTGEICRRPEAFHRFVNNRKDDVRSRRALELERDFPFHDSGINQFPTEPSTATAGDVKQRETFERKRYVELVFTEKPLTPAMTNYGRKRLGEIIDIGRLRRAA